MENIGDFEKKIEDKIKKLYPITLERVKLSRISKKDEVSQAYGLIFVGSPIKIDINLYFRNIKVYREKYFNLAKKLKKDYEEHTKDIWSLHEWYD